MNASNRRRALLQGIALCLAACAGAPSSASGDDIVVIVHKDNLHRIEKSYVVDIYTGRAKGWPDGSPVFSLDQGEAEAARADFYRQVVGKSVANMQALWAQNIFAGRGLPPKLATPAAEMKRIVAANKHAIGYIRASDLDDSVKPLWRR